MSKVIVTLLLGLVFSTEAMSAGTFIIPNKRKIKREIHITPVAAAWSTRNVVGGTFTRSNTDNSTNGVLDNEYKSTDFNPYVYYHAPEGLTAELGLGKYNSEYQYFSPTPLTSNWESLSMVLNLGVQLMQTKAVFGFSIANIKTDTNSAFSGIYSSETKDTDIGVGYLFGEALYSGLGIIQYDYGSPGSTDVNLYYAGLGMVDGGKSNPSFAGEIVLLDSSVNGDQSNSLYIQGFLNNGPAEYWGGLIYSLNKFEAKKSASYTITGAVDYDLESIYLLPEVSYYQYAYTGSSTDTERKETTVSLEVGHREATYSACFRYKIKNNSDTRTGASDTIYTEKGPAIFAGANYYF